MRTGKLAGLCNKAVKSILDKDQEVNHHVVLSLVNQMSHLMHSTLGVAGGGQ